MLPGAEIIFFYTGEDAGGKSAYAFLSMPADRAGQFAVMNSANDELLDFDGLGIRVLCSGKGHEPSQDHLELLRREHGYDWNKIGAAEDSLNRLF